MYERINFKDELKSIPHKDLIQFLSLHLKKNEQLQKEFIKKFNISVQQKFIQEYVDEALAQAQKNRRSIGRGEFIYYVTQFNKLYLHPKISYLKTLIKQKQYLESLKIAIALHHCISHIVAQNGFFEDLGSLTTAEKYENKWNNLEDIIIECYLNLREEEYFLFDKRYVFELFKNSYDLLLKSPIFNFIEVRDHAKLNWLKKKLREEDIELFEKIINF
ncbi:MAG: hypothetical protein ACLFPL_03005 [Candidatus Nanoarchaeia archaeon]